MSHEGVPDEVPLHRSNGSHVHGTDTGMYEVHLDSRVSRKPMLGDRLTINGKICLDFW